MTSNNYSCNSNSAVTTKLAWDDTISSYKGLIYKESVKNKSIEKWSS